MRLYQELMLRVEAQRAEWSLKRVSQGESWSACLNSVIPTVSLIFIQKTHLANLSGAWVSCKVYAWPGHCLGSVSRELVFICHLCIAAEN